MLNFIYYPVSAIMWFWHKAFGFLFGEASGIAWALSVVFLVFTLRALLYKPFVSQVRSMRKMQEFAPEIQKLKKKYGNDRQKMAAEMQKLQSQQGVNPLGGCLPVLVQVPVFIGLFHVLREFKPGKTENYFFGASEVESFNEASLFGAKLGAWVTQGADELARLGTSIPAMLIVMIPLMIAAGIFTHITARHSVARQTEAQAANPQAAIMNKMMLYVFPIGVVVGAPFLPLAVLIYWVANNLWTLGQQYVVYKRIDAEETAKREQATAVRQARAPRPGQKPNRDAAANTSANASETAAENVDEPTPAADDPTDSRPAKKPGAKPVSKSSGAKPNGTKPSGKSGGGSNGSATSRNGRATGGGSRPPAARRGRKRR
ncbi:membrane protein insertase YidC [Pseudonocardia bannensis]|uniref:Membrane protein insertase YidC n=1 Tax=Pseudonocardia bannensis TaxID=630973 RepID=A0A848DFU5_9PSEU|nr:membrane protein insertase YidC [Pseudonocardia bannensis]NMH91522.1 membrane protein insertase YidC [Pseudonocardia bannensis]